MKGMRSFLEELRIDGKEERPFMLRGPLGAVSATTQASATTPRVNVGETIPTGLVSESLEGQLGFGWKSLQYAGLHVGAADIHARLQKGTIDFVPLDIPVSDGR